MAADGPLVPVRIVEQGRHVVVVDADNRDPVEWADRVSAHRDGIAAAAAAGGVVAVVVAAGNAPPEALAGSAGVPFAVDPVGNAAAEAEAALVRGTEQVSVGPVVHTVAVELAAVLVGIVAAVAPEARRLLVLLLLLWWWWLLLLLLRRWLLLLLLRWHISRLLLRLALLGFDNVQKADSS